MTETILGDAGQSEASRQFLAAFDAELQRLGLRATDLPAFAISGDQDKAFEEILSHLRSLAPGATWHDVFPDLPRDWIPGRPETWITAYRPIGPWDYQELPTGQAIHIIFKCDASRQSWLESFVDTAREAGWPIHGARFPFERKTDDTRRWEDAIIVLSRGTDFDTFHGFLAWINEQSSVELAAVSRTGEERYRE